MAFAGFVLVSCKKESGAPNTNVVPPPPPPPPPPPADTSALGKFVKATGITDGILKVSLDSLITRARSHGWWDQCLAIYPLAGGTSTSTSFNLKDTAAYQLIWSGPPVFAAAGATFDGIGAVYGNTMINDSLLAYNNAHISYYSNTTDTTINQWVMGVDDAVAPYNEFSITNAGFKQAVAYFFTNNGTFSADQSSTSGWYLVSSGSTDVRIYKDGADITATTESPVDIHTNSTFLIGSSRNAGGTNTQCAFSTIGSNIDSTMAAQMYADIKDFVNEK